MSLARAIALTQNRVYTGPAQYLSDPTDLLHAWSCRDVSRNSGLLGATLKRTADGAEADFGFTSKGFLDRTAVLAWAGASAVTVARLWGLGGEQLGPELLANTGFASSTGWTPDFTWSIGGGVATVSGSAQSRYLTQNFTSQIGKLYRVEIELVSTTLNGSGIGLSSTGFGGVTLFKAQVPGKLLFFETAASENPLSIVRSATSDTGTAVISAVSVREVLRPNAVQTTTANQPPLDLTANPLRIGAAVGKSLVATLPNAIANAHVLLADRSGVTRSVSNIDAGERTLTFGETFNELAFLAADTPQADVAKVQRNMAGAWKASEIPTDAMVLVMRTTTANEPFTLFANNIGTYNATISWGDGSQSTITAFNDADLTHTYATPGDHVIQISGAFPQMQFLGTETETNGAKLRELRQWGTVQWLRMEGSFRRTLNIRFAATDAETAGTGSADNWANWAVFGVYTTMPKIPCTSTVSFASAFNVSTALQHWPAGFFDHWAPPSGPATNCFVNSWGFATALTQQSIKNIVVSIVASGVNAPASGKAITLNGAATLATIQADTEIMAAVATLKSRGWEPNYKGTLL